MSKRRRTARHTRLTFGPRFHLVDHEWQDRPVEQHNQPSDRTAERKRPLAVVEPGVPAHALREVEPAQGCRNHGREDLARGSARRLPGKKQVALVGLGRVLHPVLQLLDGHAVFLCKALGRAGPLARRVLSGLEGRTPDRLLAVGLSDGHVASQDQPARGLEDLDVLRLEELPARGLREAQAELVGQTGQPGRRHLLEADLEEELAKALSHARPPPRTWPRPSRCPRPPPAGPRRRRRSRRPASGCSGSSPPARSPRSLPARRAR